MTVAETLRFAEGPVRIRARWVLPIWLPPISEGELIVEGGRILHVGKSTGRADIDLGNVALMPGFVNVHTHVEYTVLRGLLEDRAFFPWVRALTALKSHLTLDDWIASATWGAAEMLAAGVTTIGDCSDSGAAVNALISSGLRGIVYKEVFGIEAEPSAESIVRVLDNKLAELRAQIFRAGAEERIGLGVSPHAPYTVRAELLEALSVYCQKKNLGQQIHLAESPAEARLFSNGDGEFAEMFARRGIRFESRGETAIRHALNCQALDAPTVAVHCVQATEEDISTLAAKGAAVAHCPRSNGKLAAGFAPLAAMGRAGIAIGIGTDSTVSGNSVDIFEELRFALYNSRARERDPLALTARQALQMATQGGAKVLGAGDELGTLAAGKRADVIAVRLDGMHLHPAPEDSVEAALVYGARASDVLLTVVGGEAVYESGRFPRLDRESLRQSLSATRTRVAAEARRNDGATG